MLWCITELKMSRLFTQFLLLTLLTPTLGQIREKFPEDEIIQILELAINLPELQEYFHIAEQKDRIPLIIKEFGTVNSNNLKGLTKFDTLVVVLTEEQLEKKQTQAYLNIGDWTYGGNNLRLQLNYPIEGITVNYRFNRIDGRWKIEHSLIWEE